MVSKRDRQTEAGRTCTGAGTPSGSTRTDEEPLDIKPNPFHPVTVLSQGRRQESAHLRYQS